MTNSKNPIRVIKTLEQDPDDPESLILDLSDVAGELGWKPGDILDWNDNGDGSWTLQKKLS